MAIKGGEIYFVDLNPEKWKEQTGTRPVLILSIDAINKLPLVVTVVVGTKGENITHDYPTNVRVLSSESGLPMETVVLLQTETVSSIRHLATFVFLCDPGVHRGGLNCYSF